MVIAFLAWFWAVRQSCYAVGGAVHYFDQRPVLGAVLLVLASGVGGVTVAGGQYILHDPPQLTQGITTNLTGTIVAIDGKEDARRRLWVRLTDAVGRRTGCQPAVWCVSAPKTP